MPVLPQDGCLDFIEAFAKQVGSVYFGPGDARPSIKGADMLAARRARPAREEEVTIAGEGVKECGTFTPSGIRLSLIPAPLRQCLVRVLCIAASHLARAAPAHATQVSFFVFVHSFCFRTGNWTDG